MVLFFYVKCGQRHANRQPHWRVCPGCDTWRLQWSRHCHWRFGHAKGSSQFDWRFGHARAQQACRARQEQQVVGLQRFSDWESPAPMATCAWMVSPTPLAI